MKPILKTISFICLFLVIACHGKKSQPVENKQVISKDSIESVSALSNKKFHTDSENNISQNELYQRGETIRDLITRHYGDTTTLCKIHTDTIGDQKREIILRYRQDQVFAVVDRVTAKNEEVKSNEFYYFDENNNCISHTVFDNNKRMEITDAMYGGTLIKFDVHYNQIKINDLQKQVIIQSAKASLDSLMDFYPEFRYSFNWK